MANIKLGGTTAITESSGTVTLDNAVQDNITRLGTVTSGTINKTVTGDSVPCVILYSNTLSTNTGAIEINGYFDDSIYAYYKFVGTGVRGTVNGQTQFFQVMTGGSILSSSIYYSAGHGSYQTISNAGVAVEMLRANDNAATACNLDNTWNLPWGTSGASANWELTFSNPQSSTLYKEFSNFHYTGGHADTNAYVATEHLMFNARTTAALTGIAFTTDTGSHSAGTFILYGFRK
tara:strand:- start:550 stop:1251 length:702 start_codon:yes stop_codon:yes gene_type:complete